MNTIIGKDLNKAAGLLSSGNLVAIPTETVYGLAANALDEHAVRHIFEVKKRPPSNPLIVHIADAKQIGEYASAIPPAAFLLLEKFAPGPLTLVLPRKAIIPDIVTAGRPTVAIRIPAHPMTLELLRVVGIPLAAPSANPSGYISPTRPEHVARGLAGKVGYILDGGECTTGIESTIVGFEGGVPVIYRQGFITAEDIRSVVGKVKEYSGTAVHAPGMLASHYSPHTPLVLTDDIEFEVVKNRSRRIGVINFDRYCRMIPMNQQLILGSDGDLHSAARNLYAAMHEMDEKGYDLIIASKFPPIGIGPALNDRLERAAATKI